jgi:hypothetical protein
MNKAIDGEILDQMLYTERPPCQRVLQAALQDCMDRAFSGLPDNQISIAFCLLYAANGHDQDQVQKLFFIACTGRLPWIV